MPTTYPVTGITDWWREYHASRPHVTIYVNTFYRGHIAHTISYDIKKEDLRASISEIYDHPERFVIVRGFKTTPARLVRKQDYDRVMAIMKKKPWGK